MAFHKMTLREMYFPVMITSIIYNEAFPLKGLDLVSTSWEACSRCTSQVSQYHIPIT